MLAHGRECSNATIPAISRVYIAVARREACPQGPHATVKDLVGSERSRSGVARCYGLGSGTRPSVKQAGLSRVSWPKEVEKEVLLECRRICALCYGLDGITTSCDGHLAHIDHNPSNSSKENGAFLCVRHHEDYDRPRVLTKGLTEGELREYQRRLVEDVKANRLPVWTAANVRKTRGKGVSLELHEKRLPVYQTTMAFIREMCSGMYQDDGFKVPMQFAAETELALFLYDDRIANYLAELYRRAIRLRSLQMKIKHDPGRAHEWSHEDMQLMVWFTDQFEETRARFAPFLRLRS